MNDELLSNIRGMTTYGLYAAVYKDPLTNVYNRRAWQDVGEKQGPYLALVDLDSLKFVNDTRGYRAGDGLLVTLARVLEGEFGDKVYRLAGDEFAIPGDSAGFLLTSMNVLRSRHPFFSFGVAEGLDAADKDLKNDKARRELAGCRAPTGKRPPWFYEGIA